MEISACFNCGSKDIVRNVRAIDRDEGEWDMKLVSPKDDDPTSFKAERHASVHAHVCAGCGLVMYHTDKAGIDVLKAG